MSMPKNLQDCYFFYYSACRKVNEQLFSIKLVKVLCDFASQIKLR